MDRFGGWDDLNNAPAWLVDAALLVMRAEAQVERGRRGAIDADKALGI
jgi:hypothetical protein